MSNSADILSLIGPAFFVEYGRAAGEISNRYGVEGKSVDGRWDTLNQHHEAWKKTIDREFTNGSLVLEWRWQRIVETLAVSLCSCDAISYTIVKPVGPELITFQRLVIDNPAIFTGLKFARDQYLRVVLPERGASPPSNVLSMSARGQFAFIERLDLEDVILRIKADSREAGDFINLLQLPPRLPRV